MEKIKADLHNHLGRNGYFPNFNYVIDIAEKNLGRGGIFSVTNTPQDPRYEKFVNSRGCKSRDLGNAVHVSKKDIIVVKSQEILDKKGHLIVLGLPKGKNIKSKNFEDVLKEAKEEYNAIVIADHPFYQEGIGFYLKKNIKNSKDILSQLDGWEIHNATAELWVPGLPKNANKKSLEFYNKEIKDKYDIGMISSTDGHSVDVIGRSYTKLPQPDLTNSETLVNSLRKGIKANKDIGNLVMVPNKRCAFAHLIYMVLDTARGKRIR